ncbi:cadherin-23-like isoform X2 [Pectinophora gossypiella]|uniref:cadherin-23-like isoform X2 n=1 Tax=Pectinophora gossypiella TaxID=13191 RepID=UPI00214F5EEA|nr:cadherin-23-like isoform X2 [Pectinophora gossypiella]
MAGDACILVTVLLIFAISVFGQETSSRCYYMTDAIPREPKPDDLPDLEWTGGWTDWPLIPAEPRDDVCINGWYPQLTSTSLGTIIIHMEEEIEGDVAIAKLNYDGSGTPEIVQPMVIGSFNLLSPEIRNENGAWYLYITNRQDYETPTMRRYTFDVRVPDETRAARVSLSIENIDDNDPIVRVLDACQVPELGEPRLTDCVYQVSDEDGRLSIEPMTFRLTSDREDVQIFYVEPAHITGDWFNMQITIGILSALNFESNPLHIFQITALDSWPNNHTVTVMVQVQNVEHRPPRWMEIFAVQQFDEMTEQQFQVRAIDGDTGIGKAIHYTLETDEEEDLFFIETLPGGHDGAIFSTAMIDVDRLRRDVFRLSLVAYKYDNVSFATPTPVVIIVNDINNKQPQPLQDEYTISIMEETPLSLNFAELFGFYDEDLIYAQFLVEIQGENPPGVEQAFYIAPTAGFQNQTFAIGTQDHRMLDYEDVPFQNIKLKVIATDRDNTNFTGVAEVNVNLINWNDEEPIFEEDQLVVKFKETVPKDYHVGRLRAHDRDIGDSVVHSILGNANTFLRIDEETGDIYVAIDDAFDYHRQNEFNIQVRAQDTMSEPESRHTATAQLVIELEDVNNTPPTLRLPRVSPSVEENVPEGFEINREITATDPDTTAYLQFEIDWDTSFATKQGRDTNPIEFHGCVDIETIFPNPADTREAVGRVVAKEIRHNVTIDFEEFEFLYLTVRVRDLHTDDGRDYDESTFTIIIIDMNDNWPIWASGFLNQTFSIRERSSTGVVIGSVLATDIDGPLYNQVRYTIIPQEDTPEGLVQIHFVTGQITVDENGAIDADIPPRWHLNYTVIASDKCSEENEENCPPDPVFWDTLGDNVINIVDINNKVPAADLSRFNETVYIYENAPDFTNVVKIYSIDEDRDEIYHTVRYQINYAVNQRLRDFFAIDLDSGQVYVENTNNELLDRDRGEDQHRIFINLIDNFYSEGDGNRNVNTTEVLVILLDENDNAPELPTPEELSWSISENLQEGITLDGERDVIYAPDIDEEDTPNSHVGYAILAMTVTNRDLATVPRLLNMLSPNNVTGYLQTAMPLRGYWGTYDISILAFDHGIPQQISHEVYELEIRPYNYNPPQFVFPESGTILRLALERAVVNNVLSLVNGDPLDRIQAIDDDGLDAGVVTFDIVGDADASNYFRVNNDGDNFGTLLLTQALPEEGKEFEVTIRATDGGTEPRSYSTDSTITVLFVPTLGDPIFQDNTYSVAFFEKEVGLTERFSLPLAEDPKNKLCTDDCHDIYYRIFGGVDYEPFDLDPVTNVIFLKSELDRETTATHVVQVAASNSPTGGGIPLPGSLLTVTVTVREADPRPVFEQRLYTAGISTSDNINRELLTVRATHSENAQLTYTIEDGSMAVDSTLEAVKDSAFHLNAQTGVLILRIQPTASMQGMFEFNVIATDPDEKTDTAEVKVYLISSQNRVSFIFLNDVETVESNRDFIAETFSVGFNMTCNIDQVLPGTNDAGVIQEAMAEVHAHFIQDNIPVSADSIEELRSDTQLLRSVQGVLNQRLLVLNDLVTGVSPDLGTAGVQITIYVLAGLSAILAFLCLILLITFIVRTRALNRRLEALSMTKYGSVDSGLNRVGIAAPGTNKHAIEGSNPIWNEQIKAPDFDAISDTSDESDLIGIEDLPQFKSDYFPPEDSESAHAAFSDRTPRGNDAPIAHSSNNFGFNTSPFSAEFTNRRMRP